MSKFNCSTFKYVMYFISTIRVKGLQIEVVQPKDYLFSSFIY